MKITLRHNLSSLEGPSVLELWLTAVCPDGKDQLMPFCGIYLIIQHCVGLHGVRNTVVCCNDNMTCDK